jgi:signal transduction histidine kinase
MFSPALAHAKLLRREFGEDIGVVFIGPCIAKKLEARDPSLPPVVDEVLTFKEIISLLSRQNIFLPDYDPLPFDPPEAGMGRAFPLSGGLLKSSRMEVDLLDSQIVTASGQEEVTAVLASVAMKETSPFLIEPLMCQGCHDGPGMSSRDLHHGRKDIVKKYVTDCCKQARETPPQNRMTIEDKGGFSLCLERGFQTDDHRLKEPTEQEIRDILALTNKFAPGDELNCKACGYDTCRTKAIAVYHGLAEEAMCLPFMIEQAERVCAELHIPWCEIRQVHRHLINTEKLASMGQLAAGVAHELNNPLGTILLYTNLLQRKIKDQGDLSHDLDLLVEEAQRCRKIVGGLLDFARQNRVRLETLNVGELLRHIIAGSFQSNSLDEAGIKIIYENQSPDVEADIDGDQMTQVFVNLLKNACESMEAKGGEIRVRAEELTNNGPIRVSVTDQGCGISPDDQERIFQPFFTTKGIGKGVGLGLPICYGIVKMHCGTIWCESVVGSGTTFHIALPKTQTMAGRSMLS